MANSKYEYTREFEQPDRLSLNTWIVIRIDGRGFTKMCAKYEFEKPNDKRALDVMNSAAYSVVSELPDIMIAYGQSDEYSFVFHRTTALFNRRASKLISTVVSIFTANYVYHWSKSFPDTPLTQPLPSFDGRAVCYPTENIRDYLNWRQADCHINNLFNSTFWSLAQKTQKDGTGPLTNQQAEEELKGTLSANKNEILFSKFGINYNKEPEIFKKGTVIYRGHEPGSGKTSKRGLKVQIGHDDIIGDGFWKERPWLME